MKDNKLIAEFMGLSIKDDVSYYTDENDMFPMGIEVDKPYLPYDKSWDWLIPVIKKIDSYANEEMSIDEYDNYRNKYFFISDISVHNDISDIYNQVVEFIKEYNKYICGSCGDHVNEVVFNEDADVDECTNCTEYNDGQG